MSKDFAKLMQSYDIKHVKTGLYSPQANSSERVNREILSKIRIFVKGKHDEWDKHVSQIGAILRSDFHSSIKCSPYFALFGQHMVFNGSEYTLLRKLKCFNESDIHTIPTPDKMLLMRERIKDNLHSAHLKAERCYNLRAKSIAFVPGQKVFRRNFEQSSFVKSKTAKFSPKFIKCRVRRRIGSSLYELENLKGKLIGRYHAKDIRQ